jgi:CheY-like chemotaxis protein
MMRTEILVVDDNRDLRETVSAALEEEGYAVRCAENGAQALALMLRAAPSAVLLDLSMPVMSGWDLLEAVREDAALSRVPVVVLSALRAPVGFTHLSKPVSLDELLTTVDRLCQR